MEYFFKRKVALQYNPVQDKRLTFLLLPPTYRYQNSFYQRSLTDNKLSEEQVSSICEEIYKATENFFEYKALNERMVKLGLTFLISFSLIVVIAIALLSDSFQNEMQLDFSQEVLLPLGLLAMLLCVLFAAAVLHYKLGQKQNHNIVKDSIEAIIIKRNESLSDMGLQLVLEEVPPAGVYGTFSLLLKYKDRSNNRSNSRSNNRNNESYIQLNNSLNMSIGNVSQDSLIVQRNAPRHV